jgi:hypothetical protein
LGYYLKPEFKKLLMTIEKTFPIPGRFRSKLPGNVAELSRLLTTARAERDTGYLNRPNLLSAYLYYFLPWNIFRLCWLFSLQNESSLLFERQSFLSSLKDGDLIADLGSGPLTFPIALWIAFPELRRVKLEFRCVDKSAAILDAGYKLFKALSNRNNEVSGGAAWKIKTIHDSIYMPRLTAKLVTAVNLFNEVISGRNSVEIKKAAALLAGLCDANGSILVVEPGNPQGGAFISALRSVLLEREKYPASPCPHAGPCPLPGKKKWCHFAFETGSVPAILHKLSLAAGIPKERATLSFLLTQPEQPAGIKSWTAGETINVRIISDTFPVSIKNQEPRFGCYGCSKKGLVLVTGNPANLGSRINSCTSGALLKLPFIAADAQKDRKTGALIVPLDTRIFPSYSV